MTGSNLNKFLFLFLRAMIVNTKANIMLLQTMGNKTLTVVLDAEGVSSYLFSFNAHHLVVQVTFLKCSCFLQ